MNGIVRRIKRSEALELCKAERRRRREEHDFAFKASTHVFPAGITNHGPIKSNKYGRSRLLECKGFTSNWEYVCDLTSYDGYIFE